MKGSIIMKRTLTSAVAIAFVLAFGLPLAAQDAQVVGAWRVKDFVSAEVESKKVLRPFGEKPAGYYIFSADGVFTAVVFDSERKAHAAAAPTDAERVELFKTIGVTTGRYTVSGKKVTINVDGALAQKPVGTTQVREADITGDTLAFKSPQIPGVQTGVPVVFIVTLERVKK
jgi:Lipocalin-like domain